ncbi:hypothetical protein V6Z11_D11G233400 [Gossypium hirsutum]
MSTAYRVKSIDSVSPCAPTIFVLSQHVNKKHHVFGARHISASSHGVLDLRTR